MAKPNHHRREKNQSDRPPRLVATGQGKRGPSRTEVACWITLLAAAIGALIWKHSTVFFLSWTDEQIHFYVAHRMAEGAVLYRDVNSARPPLVLYPVAWLIRAGCSPLLAGRALVVASQLATGALLLWGGWRLVSWRVGLLAALLFLTSPETFSRIHYTGIHLAALTASACVLFSLRAQALRAGLCFGLSLAADQHGLAVCGVAALLTIGRRPREALPFAMGAATVGAVVFGAVWVMGGRHLWQQLFGIHLFHLRLGQGADSHFWELAAPWVYEHGYLFVGAALAAFLLGFRRTGGQGGDDWRSPLSRDTRVLLLALGVHLALVLAMTEAAFLYVVVIAPLLSLLAALGFEATVIWLRATRTRRVSPTVAAGAAAVLALTAGGWAAARSHREGLDERHYSFLPHVLHGEVSRFHQLDVAQRVAGDSILPKHGTIFGDPTIVSAVALRNGRRVSGELADLNPSWIAAGSVGRRDVVSRIERDGVAAVITPPWHFVQDPYFKSYLLACYQEPKVFLPPERGPGEGLPEILVFPHVPGKYPCQPP